MYLNKSDIYVQTSSQRPPVGNVHAIFEDSRSLNAGWFAFCLSWRL